MLFYPKSAVTPSPLSKEIGWYKDVVPKTMPPSIFNSDHILILSIPIPFQGKNLSSIAIPIVIKNLLIFLAPLQLF